MDCRLIVSAHLDSSLPRKSATQVSVIWDSRTSARLSAGSRGTSRPSEETLTRSHCTAALSLLYTIVPNLFLVGASPPVQSPPPSTWSPTTETPKDYSVVPSCNLAHPSPLDPLRTASATMTLSSATLAALPLQTPLLASAPSPTTN